MIDSNMSHCVKLGRLLEEVDTKIWLLSFKDEINKEFVARDMVRVLRQAVREAESISYGFRVEALTPGNEQT